MNDFDYDKIIKLIKNPSQLSEEVNSLSEQDATQLISLLIKDKKNFKPIFMHYSDVLNFIYDMKDNCVELQDQIYLKAISQKWFDIDEINNIKSALSNGLYREKIGNKRSDQYLKLLEPRIEKLNDVDSNKKISDHSSQLQALATDASNTSPKQSSLNKSVNFFSKHQKKSKKNKSSSEEDIKLDNENNLNLSKKSPLNRSFSDLFENENTSSTSPTRKTRVNPLNNNDSDNQANPMVILNKKQ